MTVDQATSASQVQQLIERAKSVRPLSQATRARVLRRAHSSAQLAGLIDVSKTPSPWVTAPATTWLGGAAFAVGFGVASVALHLHESRIPSIDHATSAVSSTVAVATNFETAPAPSAFLGAPESVASARSMREAAPNSRPAPILESYDAELVLLRRAHTAYGNHDYAAALRLLADHGRRFPNGRLSEEREALRVRALSGSGLNGAARLAAQAFAARFPHSVLSTRTITAADAGE